MAAIFWAGLLALVIIMYVILDGFTLGVGMLFPFVQKPQSRDIMMNSIAPVWDGNETWMVFGAALLYGAFPVAYSTLLPVLYMPILIMLAALIFRGVAFEFRFKMQKTRPLWSAAFSAGSYIAAFFQGMLLGTFVIGYGDESPLSLAGHYSWFTPFSVVSGIGVVIAYMVLGAAWLNMKTEGLLQQKMRKAAKVLLILLTGIMGIVSLWTPIVDPFVRDRWFSIPNIYYLSPLPILTFGLLAFAEHALQKKCEVKPFILILSVFILFYIGFAISIWPYIIPRSVTIFDALSHSKSLNFLLVGIVLLVPPLIGYTIYAYYVFRGKVEADEGYH